MGNKNVWALRHHLLSVQKVRLESNLETMPVSWQPYMLHFCMNQQNNHKIHEPEPSACIQKKKESLKAQLRDQIHHQNVYIWNVLKLNTFPYIESIAHPVNLRGLHFTFNMRCTNTPVQ